MKKVVEGVKLLIAYDPHLPIPVYLAFFPSMVLLGVVMFIYHQNIGNVVLGLDNIFCKFVLPFIVLFIASFKNLSLPPKKSTGFKNALTLFLKGIGLWLFFSALSFGLSQPFPFHAVETQFLVLYSVVGTIIFAHAIVKTMVGMMGMIMTSAFRLDF